jgi:V/A-type H+/Na+-transporting ATPase subunit E
MLAAAKKKAIASDAKIMNTAKLKVEEINAQAAEDADEAARRQVLIAELEARKNSLDSKRRVIEEAFSRAEKELTKLPLDKWEKLIMATVLAASESGNEQLCVPTADIEKYKNGMLTKLNVALVAAGKKGELTLASEPAKFTGGVMLIGKHSDFDGSFATILRDVRMKSEREVATMLFGTEVK